MAAPNQDILPAPVHAVALRNPFGVGKTPVREIAHGATLAEILEQFELCPCRHYHVEVLVDGVSVPAALFDKTRPKPGTSIVCIPVPHGGRTGKAVLSIVVGVGLAIASAGALLGATGVTLGTVGGVAAGGLAIYSGTSSLLAPAPTKPFDGDIPTSEQSPALVGEQNRLAPYAPVVRHFGQYLRFPRYAAKPYTEALGDDFYLRLLFDFGYGPLQLTDLKIGETPIDELVPPEDYVVHPGYDDDFPTPDAPLSIFTQGVDEDDFAVTLEDGVTVGTRTTPADTHEVSLDFTFPAGLIGFDEDDGDPEWVEVELSIQYRAAGTPDPWIDVTADTLGTGVTNPSAGEFRIRGRVRGQIIRGVHWIPPAAGQWEINVQRIDTTYQSSDQIVQSRAEDCVWTKIRSIRPGTRPRVPNLCLVEMRIKASDQLAGQVTDFNAMATSILPVWSSGEPQGDGWGPANKLSTNTSLQATRNPAWAFAEVYRGAHNPRPVSNDRIDAPSIAAWADRNTNEGIHFDAVVDFTSTIGQLARDIAGTARGAPTLIDGKYGVVVDEVKNAVISHLTPRDVHDFSGSKVFQRELHAVRVGFVNPDAGYQPDEIVVGDDGYTNDGLGGTTEPTIFGRIDLWGVADADRAWKEGRYHIAAKKLRPEIYSFETDIASLRLTRGDRFRLTHDVMLVGVVSGRITHITYAPGGEILAVTLDEALDYDPALQYGLRIRSASNETVHFVIFNIGVEAKLFIAAQPGGIDVSSLTVPPAVGDVATVGESGQETGDYIVHQVFPNSDLGARIECVDYSPEIYDADTGAIPTFDPQMTDPRAPALQVPERPQITSIASDESVLLQNRDGTFAPQIRITVTTPQNALIPTEFFQAQIRSSDPIGPWSTLPYVNAGDHAIAFPDVDQGITYDVRVRGVRADGRASEWATLSGHTVVGTSTPPPDVTDFRGEGPTRLSWSYPNPPRDWAGFELRSQAGNDTTWETAIPFHDGLITEAFVDISGAPSGERTFLVKAVDQAGNRSVNAASIVKTVNPPEFDNILETEDFHANGFTGTKTDCTVEGGSGDLVADAEGTLFWPADDQPFWPGDAEPFWDQGYKGLTYEDSYTPPAASVPNRMTIAITVTGDGWSIEYREQGGANWLPWPGEIIAQNVTYEFRVTTQPGNTEGRISEFVVQIDVDDVVEFIEDFEIAAAGNPRLPITKTYSVIKHVIVTVQGSGAGYATVIDKDATNGPEVHVFDDTGTRITRDVDARIGGY